LTAIRVVVDSVKDCYGVLGVIHTLWKPLPGRFKDYIAMPKQNMYRSLHTTVISNFGEPFEIQVRTKEMHAYAEYGIAAHFQYKEGGASKDEADEKLVWLRQMMEFDRDVENPAEFVDSIKGDIFDTQVYVFTPQGKVIELPTGSTPVDFAYKIHSEVGNRCIGAKVNGRICPLNVKLTNGVIVEVLTSKSSHGPSRDWLKFVKSAQAKNKIQHWFKKERREENIEKGRDMLEKEIKRNGFKVHELMKPEWVEPIIKRLSIFTIEDLYNAVGYGGILTQQVVPKLKEKHREEQKKNQPQPTIEEGFDEQKHKKAAARKKMGSQAIVVKGMEDLLTRFAKCCSPVPGDDIIGYITRGRGVTVHRSDCPNFQKSDDVTNRFIEVAWATDQKEVLEEISFATEISIIAPDRKGLLGQVTAVIADVKLVCTGINARVTKDGIAVMNLMIETSGIAQLDKLITKIKALPDVIDVKRVKG